jgi:FixJ family two-component response regulator
MAEDSEGRPVLHIVDDDDGFRESLVALLDGQEFDVATSASVEDFLARLPTGRPACALVDLHMPRQTGLDLLGRLREARSGIPVIMMTGTGDVPSAVRAMKAGAIDFIEKPLERDRLLDAIRAAFARSRDGASRRRTTRAFHQRLDRLTDREREVLDHLLRGGSNKAIALQLRISPRTVEIHRARVLQKLEMENTAQLVHAAVHAGMVAEDA